MSENNYKYQGIGLTVKERNIGLKKFEDYKSAYSHLNQLSDLQLLEHLVFLEVLDERYKTRIGDIAKNKTAQKSGIIPSELMNALTKNSEELVKLKEKLGLFPDKNTLDAFQRYQDVQEKFDIFRKAHPLEFKTTCPFCSKIYFMKRRTKNFEPHASPFFNGGSKILHNPEVMDLWHKGIITKKQAAKIHGTSADFIDWLDEKFYNKKEEKKPDKS